MLKELLFQKDSAFTREDGRRSSRLQDEFASILINGHEYQIKDWSRGGLYFKGIANDLAVGDHMNFTLKFDLPHQTFTMVHSGRILRRHHDGFALQFDRHTPQSKENLARVMDGVLSRSFADSYHQDLESF